MRDKTLAKISKVDELRVKKGLTAKEAAKIVGITQGYYFVTKKKLDSNTVEGTKLATNTWNNKDYTTYYNDKPQKTLASKRARMTARAKSKVANKYKKKYTDTTATLTFSIIKEIFNSNLTADTKITILANNLR